MTREILARATGPDDQSDSIVVSFEAKWLGSIERKSLTSVVRRSVPKLRHFRWLYIYLNSPVSAIIGRSRLLDIRDVRLDEALQMSNLLSLSTSEVTKYFGKKTCLGCYDLETIELASKPVTNAELTDRLIYHPPQSFLILSLAGKKVIDELANFGDAAQPPNAV